MEIRKSNSVVSTVTQESTSSESAKSVQTKSTGIATAKDSFEAAPNNTQENSGKKELSSAQQQEASKMNYKDFGNNGTTSQNSRPTYEDAKNSGLAALLGHSKQENEADSKKQLPNGVTVADTKNSTSQTEQTSDAVKDAQQKLNGGRTNYRESLDQELARRRQDFTGVGGSSALDRAYSAPDPTATPKGKGEVPTGADAVAYGEVGERKNKDGSVTSTYDEVTSNKNGSTTVSHGETTVKKDGTVVVENKGTTYSGNFKYEIDSKNVYDPQLNLTKKTQTDTAYANGKLVATETATTTYNKDGSTTTTTTLEEKKEDGSTTTTTTKETTKPGETSPSYGFDGKPGSSYGYMPLPPGVDDDRATGDIPDYIRNQINQTKPKKGGETELTDGGVTGNSADGTPINNAFTRTGGVMGAVAQPTRASEYVGGPSNVTVGSAIQNGGATDSLDGSSWTGTTHQDDPGDVQFGPAETPKQQASKKSEDSSDSSNSILDSFRTTKSK